MSTLLGFVSARLANGVFGVGVPLLLARWMSVEDFASYIIVLTAAAIGGVLGSFGIDKVLYRHLPRADDAGDARLAAVLIAGAMGVRMVVTPLFTMAVLYSGFVPVPPEQRLFVALLGGAFSLALGPSDVLSAAANSLLHFDLQAKVYLAGLVLRLTALLALGGSTGSLDLATVFWVLLAGEALQALVLAMRAVGPSLAAMRRRPRSAVPARLRDADWADMRSTAVSSYVSYLVYLPWQGSMLRLMAGLHAAALEFASYGFVQTLADRLRQYLPLQLLQTAVEPMLVRQVAAGYGVADMARQLDFLRRMSTYPLLIGAALAFVCGDALIGWVTAGKYPHAGFLAALCLLGLASAMLTSVVWIGCLATGNMPTMMRATTFNSFILLPLLWAASRYAGPTGVALVSLCVGPVLWGSMRVLGCDAVRGVWAWRKDLAVCACLAAAVLGGAWLPAPQGLLPAHGWGILAVLAVGAGLLAWGQLGTRVEVDALRALLQPRKAPAAA